MKNQKFTITKRIAKHGNQMIIIVPSILKEFLKPDTLVKLDIEVLEK